MALSNCIFNTYSAELQRYNNIEMGRFYQKIASDVMRSVIRKRELEDRMKPTESDLKNNN